MEMTRRISAELGSKERGYRVAWQAVVDGLKLTPKNPSFLTARGAILRALKDLKGTAFTEAEYPEVRKAAWGSFARYGMGFDAFCPNASFTGCRAKTQLPRPDTRTRTVSYVVRRTSRPQQHRAAARPRWAR